jgi:hypothetical protein
VVGGPPVRGTHLPRGTEIAQTDHGRLTGLDTAPGLYVEIE